MVNNQKKIIGNRKKALILIVVFVLSNLVLISLRISSILYFLFPLGSFFLGFLLYYLQYSSYYLSFTWCIWFISPLVSRIVHYQNGWIDKLPLITYTPYFVTLVSAISFFRFFPKYYKYNKQDVLPFLLALISLFYSLLIGLIKNDSFIETIGDCLRWTPGIFLGFYLLANWRNYPALSQITKNTFLWSLLIMGIYGIVQYFIPFGWDKFWLLNAENLQNAIGHPEAWNIRVWSTLNMPFTFAYGIIPCLLITSTNRSNLSKLALIFGFLAFGLSQVRGAWISFLISVILLFTSFRFRSQIILIKSILGIIVIIFPLTFSDAFFRVVFDRVQSLGNLDDTSFQARLELYNINFNDNILEIIGRGMGGDYLIDADALSLIVILGWLGSILYLLSLTLIIIKFLEIDSYKLDLFAKASRASCIGILLGLPFFNVFTLLPATMFWSFVGFTLASNKHFQYQIKNKYIYKCKDLSNKEIKNV